MLNYCFAIKGMILFFVSALFAKLFLTVSICIYQAVYCGKFHLPVSVEGFEAVFFCT